jgi:hypothetical protein
MKCDTDKKHVINSFLQLWWLWLQYENDVQYLRFTPINMQSMFFLNKKCYIGYVQLMILPQH